MRKSAFIFPFLLVNGVWLLFAYLLHVMNMRPGAIAVVLAVGVLLGNLATYAGVKLAGKLLHKSG